MMTIDTPTAEPGKISYAVDLFHRGPQSISKGPEI